MFWYQVDSIGLSTNQLRFLFVFSGIFQVGHAGETGQTGGQRSRGSRDQDVGGRSGGRPTANCSFFGYLTSVFLDVSPWVKSKDQFASAIKGGNAKDPTDGGFTWFSYV